MEQRVIPGKSRDYSSWIWLAFLVGLAVVTEVVAVRYGDLGLAISGIGTAILGAFGFLCPPSFTADIRIMLRAPANADPRAAALAGVGGVLLLISLTVKWLG